MEPYTKKRRRLAPKLAEKPVHDQIPEQRRLEYPPPLPPVQDTPQPSGEQDLERLARHLQDAASCVYNRANRSQYSSVSVLLIRWEDDRSVEHDVLNLEKIFRQRYNFRTEAWSIPTCPNPNVKLSIHLAQQIEYARPGHLLIVYYVGYSFVGSSDHLLYWACNPREDSPKLKWEGIRCLIEDAHSDILLLLDCGAVPDATTGSNGVKQAIAAYGREHSILESRPRVFTSTLIEALLQLSGGPPFSVQRLHEEIISRRLEHPGLSNGSSKFSPAFDSMPITFALTPGTLKTIILSPLAPMRPTASQMASPLDSPDGDNRASGNGERSLSNNAQADLIFEEPRALVYISLQGEPSHEMTSFKHRLNSTPAMAAKVTVEGMFQGPPTLMLISMPIAMLNAIDGDQNRTLLGYIKSHNMLREYQKLLDVSTTISSKTTSKQLEDGKILLEAAEANASSPSAMRHESQPIPVPNMIYQPIASLPNLAPPPPPPTISERPNVPERKEVVEDSDEMHEAAIQLKALSHVRPLGQDSLRNERSTSRIPHENSPSVRSHHDESGSSQEGGDSGADENPYSSEYNSPASRPKARRSIQKQGPKQDTRCSMCSHAPFKDSSSLRKHVAAAHTRPFPCAFSFAGCPSTFGSKNEWKRHIASQHLCLTYYRCSSCPQSTVEGKGNEFNRKDLFTQHLRRMHAPFAIKKAIAKGDSKLQLEWETHVKEMQASCLVTRRCPPTQSACPKANCSNLFEGTGSWDDWTEHVGRHMEKGEASPLGVDRLLAKWALDQGIIERKEDGEYRLCGQEREGNGVGYHSDATSKKEVDNKIEDTIMLDETGR